MPDSTNNLYYYPADYNHHLTNFETLHNSPSNSTSLKSESSSIYSDEQQEHFKSLSDTAYQLTSSKSHTQLSEYEVNSTNNFVTDFATTTETSLPVIFSGLFHNVTGVQLIDQTNPSNGFTVQGTGDPTIGQYSIKYTPIKTFATTDSQNNLIITYGSNPSINIELSAQLLNKGLVYDADKQDVMLFANTPDVNSSTLKFNQGGTTKASSRLCEGGKVIFGNSSAASTSNNSYYTPRAQTEQIYATMEFNPLTAPGL